MTSPARDRGSAPRVELVCVGTELLAGKPNTHAAYFASLLEDLGLPLRRETTVGDDPADMASAFRDAWRRSDVVIATGGLGPTFDDLTRDVWAKILRRRLVFHPEIAAGIRDRFRQRGLPMPPANRRQAQVLAGARALLNPNGTAPGQRFERGRKTLFLLPGPGRELKPLVDCEVTPFLRARFSSGARRTGVWRFFGLAESAVDQRLRGLMGRAGAGLGWGILAQRYVVDVKVTAAGPGEGAVRDRLSRVDRALRKRFGESLFGVGRETLEEVVTRRLRERGETLAVAESCTGGLVAQKITSVAGSSRCFWGGWVVYDNAAKRRLGVTAETLRRHGAVSKACALALAAQARRRSGADHALALTGVAGPTGGTAEKPVGRVYIALASAGAGRCWEWNFRGDRDGIREQSALWALNLLRRKLGAGGAISDGRRTSRAN